MKRIICIILVLVLVFTFMIFSVSAAPVDSFVGTGINLLDNYASFTWVSDITEFTTSSPRGSFYSTEFPYMGGRVNFLNEAKYVDYQEIYLYFSCTSEVDYVEFTYFLDNDWNMESCTPTLIYSGDSYIYSVSFFPYIQFRDDLTFDIILTDAAEFLAIELLYMSAYPLFNIISELSSAALRVSGTRINSGDHAYYRDIIYDNEISFPHTFNHTQEGYGGDPIGDDLLTFFLQFDFDDVYFDKLQFTFVSTGVWANYYNPEELSVAGCYLEGVNGSFNLPYTVDSSIMDSSWYGLPVFRHTVTIDLSGYNVAYSRLTFSSQFYGRYPYANNQFLDWFLKFESAYIFTYSQVDQPWYRTFFGWLDTSLTNFFNGLGDSIWAGADKITDKLDSLFGQESSEQMEAVSNAVDNMNAAGDKFEQANEDLEALMPAVPSYDEIGLKDLSSSASSSIQVTGDVFSSIWESEIVMQLLTYVVLLSLGGFILFGER